MTELPTRAHAVEDWLRRLAGPSLPPDGVYPYLFGMATVKLAEAHAEIIRLRTELERVKEEAADAL